MSKLEYKLGNVEIEKPKLTYLGNDPKEVVHRFLVVGNGTTIYGYVAPLGHIGIVKNNKLEDTRVLGGRKIYLDKNGDLVFSGLSLKYGSVPNVVTDKLAKLIQGELKKIGVDWNKVVLKPEGDIKEHKWALYGFKI